MRFFLSFLLLLITGFACTAQDSLISLSRFELFSSTPGQLFKTQIREIGTVGFAVIDKVKTVSLQTGNSVSAIKIRYALDRSSEVVNINALYITMDELDSVINTLTFFAEEIEKGKQQNNLYYTYVTPSNVQISCHFNTHGFANRSVYLGRMYQKLYIVVPQSVFYFNKKRISELIYVLKQAKGVEFE